jgi:hypothetical protein
MYPYSHRLSLEYNIIIVPLWLNGRSSREFGKSARPMDMAPRFDRMDPYDMMVNGRMICPSEPEKSQDVS